MDTALYLEFVEICGVCGVYFETTNWTTKDDYHHRGSLESYSTVPTQLILYSSKYNKHIVILCRRLSAIPKCL